MTQFEGNSIGGLSARLRGEFYSRRDNGGTLDYVPHNWRLITASGTATQADGLILADCRAGNITISLPDAATMSGHLLAVKKVDPTAYTVTIDGYLGQSIDGAGGQTITTQYGRIGIETDGVTWWIVMSAGTVNAVTFTDSGALWALVWFGAGNGFAGRQRAQTRALSRGQLYLQGQTFAGR
jgi:hypothetical protein